MSPIEVLLQRTLSRPFNSRGLRDLLRTGRALARQFKGSPATVHYFHQDDDPYSELAAQSLIRFGDRYDIRLQCHRVPPPSDAAAPDRARLESWSVRDAKRLGDALGLNSENSHVWDTLDLNKDPQQGGQLRERLGHYLGATFYFEGEWYWGIDRLHYLEERLSGAGLARAGSPQGPLYPPQSLQWRSLPHSTRTTIKIDFYCSFRSPYTYLAAAQIRKIAQHYGATLRLRPVLPMVMRGLPVPKAKRLYITRDVKREADRLGIRFGHAVDPVGKPAERGLALLHHAIPLGKGSALAESFLQGVFADGIYAGDDEGLWQIAERAGVSRPEMDSAIADPSWHAVAEVNRQEMLDLGCWGVPSFRVNDCPAIWGNDRLWMVEQDLISVLTQNTTTETMQ